MGSTKTTIISGTQPVVESNSDSQESQSRKRKSRVRGQKYKAARSKVDKSKLYSLSEAIKLVRETDIASFDSTVELHMTVKKVGLTAKVTLPHSSGSTKTIEIANDKTLEKLESGKIDFDILLSTAEFMPQLVKYARVLGPKGMMPNPKNGTVIKSEKDAKNFSIDEMLIKTERKAPIVHTIIGKLSLSDKELQDNAEAIINAVGKRQITKLFVTSSMSPSVKILLEQK